MEIILRKFYRIKKNDRRMERNVGIAVVVGIAIIIGVIVIQINQTMWDQVSVEEYYEKDGKVASVVYPDNPQMLGPLQINKDKYLLGENVYVILKDIMPGDKGTVQFFTPGGILYDEWKFDGNEKNFYKKYFKPQLLKSKNLCGKEMLVGEWSVMFEGFDMAKLYFTISGDILPNHESHFVECDISYTIDLTEQVFPEKEQP